MQADPGTRGEVDVLPPDTEMAYVWVDRFGVMQREAVSPQRLIADLARRLRPADHRNE